MIKKSIFYQTRSCLSLYENIENYGWVNFKNKRSCIQLKLHDTPSTHLFEDHIVYQMKNSMGGVPDKNEGGERIEMFF